MTFGPCFVFVTCRSGSIQVFAMVELERYGVTNTSIEEKMKSDVTQKVRNMVASNLQDGYVFSPDEFAVQDPTSGNLLLHHENMSV